MAVLSAAVPGAAIQRAFAQPTATGTLPAPGTTAWVSGLRGRSYLLESAPTARTAGWPIASTRPRRRPGRRGSEPAPGASESTNVLAYVRKTVVVSRAIAGSAVTGLMMQIARSTRLRAFHHNVARATPVLRMDRVLRHRGAGRRLPPWLGSSSFSSLGFCSGGFGLGFGFGFSSVMFASRIAVIATRIERARSRTRASRTQSCAHCAPQPLHSHRSDAAAADVPSNRMRVRFFRAACVCGIKCCPIDCLPVLRNVLGSARVLVRRVRHHSCSVASARDQATYACGRGIPRRPIGLEPRRRQAVQRCWHGVAEQKISEHWAAEGPTDDRSHHRLSQVPLRQGEAE
jgi:hypothetical protein